MRSKKILSVILNFLIFALVATVFTVRVLVYDDTEQSLMENGLAILKFFTVQSNVLMGIVALVFGCYRIRELKIGKLPPKAIFVIKHVATAGVALTFLTVVLYLSPINPAGYFDLFTGANFFFHFLVPVIAIVAQVFFDGEKMPFSYTVFGVIPMFLYGLWYIVNALTHLENGKVVPEYDWYYFLQGGTVMSIAIVVGMIVLAFAISALMWLIEKAVNGRK